MTKKATYNLKSAHRFTTTMWSAKYYGKKLKIDTNIFHGYVTDNKTKEMFHFHNAVQYMKIIDKLYRKQDKK